MQYKRIDLVREFNDQPDYQKERKTKRSRIRVVAGLWPGPHRYQGMAYALQSAMRL